MIHPLTTTQAIVYELRRMLLELGHQMLHQQATFRRIEVHLFNQAGNVHASAYVEETENDLLTSQERDENRELSVAGVLRGLERRTREDIMSTLGESTQPIMTFNNEQLGVIARALRSLERINESFPVGTLTAAERQILESIERWLRSSNTKLQADHD